MEPLIEGSGPLAESLTQSLSDGCAGLEAPLDTGLGVLARAASAESLRGMGGVKGVPQRVQNFMPRRTSLPQLGHGPSRSARLGTAGPSSRFDGDPPADAGDEDGTERAPDPEALPATRRVS